MMQVIEKLWTRSLRDLTIKYVYSGKEWCSVRGPSFYVHLKRFQAQSVTSIRTRKYCAGFLGHSL